MPDMIERVAFVNHAYLEDNLACFEPEREVVSEQR